MIEKPRALLSDLQCPRNLATRYAISSKTQLSKLLKCNHLINLPPNGFAVLRAAFIPRCGQSASVAAGHSQRYPTIFHCKQATCPHSLHQPTFHDRQCGMTSSATISYPFSSAFIRGQIALLEKNKKKCRNEVNPSLGKLPGPSRTACPSTGLPCARPGIRLGIYSHGLRTGRGPLSC